MRLNIQSVPYGFLLIRFLYSPLKIHATHIYFYSPKRFFPVARGHNVRFHYIHDEVSLHRLHHCSCAFLHQRRIHGRNIRTYYAGTDHTDGNNNKLFSMLHTVCCALETIYYAKIA
jgi:hypothetical protein